MSSVISDELPWTTVTQDNLIGEHTSGLASASLETKIHDFEEAVCSWVL